MAVSNMAASRTVRGAIAFAASGLANVAAPEIVIGVIVGKLNVAGSMAEWVVRDKLWPSSWEDMVIELMKLLKMTDSTANQILLLPRPIWLSATSLNTASLSHEQLP